MATNPCCCIALKTGAFIVGILEIVFSSIYLILAIIGLVTTELIKSAVKDGKTDLPVTAEDLSGLTTGLIITTVLLVLNIIMTSVLIHGIRMERSRLLQVWLVFNSVGLALSFVGILVAGLFMLLFVCLIGFYFIIVVNYLFVEFRNAESGRSGQVPYTPTPLWNVILS